MLSAEELLAGASLTYDVALPARVLDPGGGGAVEQPGAVKLRPLTVADLQLISRAAKDSDQLSATLMVQRALVEPGLSVTEVASMHAGLLDYLLAKVNAVSGIGGGDEQLDAAVDAPLTKAAFVLAREYGWTPREVNDLTLGQVMLNLKMLKDFRIRVTDKPTAGAA